jgi:hypothetical protein
VYTTRVPALIFGELNAALLLGVILKGITRTKVVKQLFILLVNIHYMEVYLFARKRFESRIPEMRKLHLNINRIARCKLFYCFLIA